MGIVHATVDSFYEYERLAVPNRTIADEGKKYRNDDDDDERGLITTEIKFIVWALVLLSVCRVDKKFETKLFRF